tara:strand:- start:969 stop:1328 length:360 start_codon:yes stop_codon:yes gene_type:complete
MNTTNSSYQEDPYSSKDELIAQLTININKNEEFGYTCDWDSTDKGIEAISSIFYGIAYDDLMEKILKELKEQCVLEDNEEDFLSILDTIKDFVMSTEKNKDENSGGDSLAVSPRDVLKL